MSEEGNNSTQEEITEYLSDAILRSDQARGLVLAMVTKNGRVFTRGAGGLVMTLGLAEALHIEAANNWNDAADEINDAPEVGD